MRDLALSSLPSLKSYVGPPSIFLSLIGDSFFDGRMMMSSILFLPASAILTSLSMCFCSTSSISLVPFSQAFFAPAKSRCSTRSATAPTRIHLAMLISMIDMIASSAICTATLKPTNAISTTFKTLTKISIEEGAVPPITSEVI